MNYTHLEPMQLGYTTEPPAKINSEPVVYVEDHIRQYDIDYNLQGTIQEKIQRYQGINMWHDMIDPKTQLWIYDHYADMQGHNNNALFYCLLVGQDLGQVPEFHSSKTKAVCHLANKGRIARILTSQWLKNLETAAVSFPYYYTQNFDPVNDASDYDMHHFQDPILPVLPTAVILDSEPLLANDTMKSVYEVDAQKYFTLLHSHVKHCLFSIVNEPGFWEYGTCITEKLQYAVLSGTIVISPNYGIYDCMQRLGLDTFSDVIDTTNQYVLDPFLRVQKNLDSNIDRLENFRAISQSTSIQQRLRNNILQMRKLTIPLQIKRLNSDLIIDKFRNVCNNSTNNKLKTQLKSILPNE
jgi:hypothetical protein